MKKSPWRMFRQIEGFEKESGAMDTRAAMGNGIFRAE